MKRDPDLSRKILFDLEAAEDWLFTVDSEGDETREREYHLELLKDEGLLVVSGRYGYRMTSRGHDFLDAIRSETIWNKTKDGAVEVGGMALGMMKDLALAYLKQEAKEKLGIDL